jgi:hypothetical protein
MEDNPETTKRREPRQPGRLRRAGFLVVALLAVGTLAAACGSGPASPGVAKAASTTSTTSGSSSQSSSYRSDLAYATCIRSHGVPNFPDPKPGGGFNITNNPNDPQLQAAQQACQNLLPGGSQQQTTGGNFTPQQQAQLLQYARCMRAHKILNFPDPTSKGLGSLNGIDMNSPQFQSASEACQPLLPNQGGSGPVTRPGSGS